MQLVTQFSISDMEGYAWPAVFKYVKQTETKEM